MVLGPQETRGLGNSASVFRSLSLGRGTQQGTLTDATLPSAVSLHKSAIRLCRLEGQAQLLGVTGQAALSLNTRERLTHEPLVFQGPSPAATRRWRRLLEFPSWLGSRAVF